MKILILSFLIMAGGEKLYEAEGRLITFRVVPGEKSAKLFLLGKKAGELSWEKDAHLISVTAFSGKSSEKLRFKEDGSSYILTEIPKSADLTLSLRAELRGKKESVKIRIQQP